jgi:hypothetical protein
VLGVCAIAGVVGARTAGSAFERHIAGATLETLQDAADVFAGHERSEIERLASMLDPLLANAQLREAFVARDRERLLAAAAPLFATMTERDRITHWYFVEPEPSRKVFLRVHRPELFGDRVDRATFLQAVATGDLGAGKELGQTAFALRVVRPWVHGGKLLGYVELAEEIDHFLAAMKERTGDEYGLAVKKKFLDEQAWGRVLGTRSNTWGDRPEVVVVGTTTFTDGIIDYPGDVETIPEHGGGLGAVERGDRTYLRGIFPVRDAAGRQVGGLFVLHDFTRSQLAVRAAVGEAVVALLVVALLAGVVVVGIARWLVFRRLRRLRRDIEASAAAAALPPSRIVAVEGDDDLGRVEAILRRVLFPARGVDPPGGGAPRSAARDNT